MLPQDRSKSHGMTTVFKDYGPYLVLVLFGTYLAHTTEVDYRGPMHVDLSFLFKLVKDILHKLGKCRNGLFVLILLKIKRLLQVTRFKY